MFEFLKKKTLYSEILNSILIVLIISMLLYSSFAIIIIFSRTEVYVNNLLDRSISIAWQEYNKFFYKEKFILETLINSTDLNDFFDKENEFFLSKIIRQENHDFWLVTNNNGEIINSNLTIEKNNFLNKVVLLTKTSWNNGNILKSSEIITLKSFSDYLKIDSITKLENDNQASYLDKVLIQIISIPLKENNEIKGCIISGKILNNNNTIANSYSEIVPNSYLTIGIEGIRISANLKDSSFNKYIGKKQPQKLIEAINNGNKYIGKEYINYNDIHLFISEPIRNSENKIIGALSVGVPSNGVTNIKKDIFIVLFISLIICLFIALILAAFIAQKVSRPLIHFSKLAKEISNTKSITEQHITLLNNTKKCKINEINYLHYCLKNMAINLHDKSQEANEYLHELKKEHKNLQENNALLEKKVEERTSKLKRAVIELEDINQLKTQFLANMSHEIRTPLNSIIGFSEMMHNELYGNLNYTQKEYLEIIIKSGKHLLQIINDILDLSRIERGKISLDKQKINITEIINLVTTIINPQIEDKKHTLKINIQENVPDFYADPLRIKQVMYNLLSNAIKFTPEGGTITLKAFTNNNNSINISVIDTGIGIDKSNQKKIFNEFYQCEDLYERKFEGVGLGLPLCKKLVELHNGSITLKSIPKKGTTVTFTLPLK